MDEIEILLATWNGEPFLDQQLDSILGQSHRRWRLLIGDDGSGDGTWETALAWTARHPQRIRLMQPGKRRNACGNFARLAAESRADYVAFCDQDDIWSSDKLELQMSEMARLEHVWGKQTPLLVHSDLQVVDAGGAMVAPSFWRHRRLDPVKGEPLNRLLTQNVVTGCTVLVNRPLLDLALPVPAEAIMHDWWLALVASALGRISALPVATVRYRQHGANVVGARKPLEVLCDRLFHPGEDDLRESLARTRYQAATFLQRFAPILSPSQRALLSTYITLGELSFFARRVKIIKYGMFKNGFLRNCIMLAVV